MQPAVRICRESLLTESSRMILSGRKGATAPFSCLPARTGSGRARSWVKGWIPCGYSGQRPEPSESFSSSISTVFKVLLSLFFHGSFFIDYLTLPFQLFLDKKSLSLSYIHRNVFKRRKTTILTRYHSFFTACAVHSADTDFPEILYPSPVTVGLRLRLLSLHSGFQAAAPRSVPTDPSAASHHPTAF